MKTKLIYITSDGAVGGGPSQILALAENVSKDEFLVSVIAPTGWLTDRVKKTKGKIQGYELSVVGYLRSALELRSILKKIIVEEYPFAPLILHCHSPKALWLTKIASRGLGVQLVYSEHLWCDSYRLFSAIRHYRQLLVLRLSIRGVGKVIAVSGAVSRFFLKNHLAIKDQIEQINPLMMPSESKPTKRHQHTSIVIGSIGALNKIKNYQLLIKAAEILVTQGVDFKIEIVGEGEEEVNLKHQIEANKLKDRVKLVGGVKSEELDAYYQRWDLYAQPSLSESFGISVFRALASGLPVVASNVGGLNEIVENKKSGILVPVDNHLSLTRAIRELCEDEKLREKMSKEAKKIVSRPEFNFEKNLNKTVNVYRGLIQKK